ncbi:hypothetical protein DXN05_11735 [Deminuibacter soli]|uniref:Uncharacterized protein n=1 Tax=Deminuibacter soli TaxID=2291815 RepID=A0A3E1NJS3_9BACT|nr:hypothetical protein DXN05_11735 [Deminuibacter soli]
MLTPVFIFAYCKNCYAFQNTFAAMVPYSFANRLFNGILLFCYARKNSSPGSNTGCRTIAPLIKQ